MRVTNLYRYYVFGWNYQILQKGFSGGYTAKQLLSNIESFQRFIVEHNLKVTTNVVGSELNTWKKNIRKKYKSSLTLHVEKEDSDKLIKYFEKITPTLNAELQLTKAYILSENRIPLDKLLEGVRDMFSQYAFDNLSYIAKQDFIEAGKCIAFERPTAAAFHILRGTEGTLRHYYEKKIKKRDKIENPMWANMITQLKDVKGTPRPLLDALDNIRTNFRNPTLHPESTYTLDEVQDLFSVCIDAVNKIMKSYHS